MDYTARYHSPLGDMTLACDGRALTGIRFVGQSADRSTLDPVHIEAPHPLLTGTARLLDRYFAGDGIRTHPPIHLRGTPFQRSVWQLLLSIPCGGTVTYGELADLLAASQGKPRMSPLAVGNALARNPVMILIPCHRVIGADGSLTGYAGGIERKRLLLKLEAGEDISADAHIFGGNGQNSP
jgi:methylated-DNA-[protein]-cysteine S-methyltransferase